MVWVNRALVAAEDKEGGGGERGMIDEEGH